MTEGAAALAGAADKTSAASIEVTTLERITALFFTGVSVLTTNFCPVTT